MAALDIGVTSLDAMGAGDDCCETMFARKRRDYSRFLREMEEEQGILYRPMVWSTWGRCHPEAQKILSDLAKVAARRHGNRDLRVLLRRTQTAIGVQLVRRSVSMLNACLPNEEYAHETLLAGQSDDAPALPRLRVVTVGDGAADCRPDTGDAPS